MPHSESPGVRVRVSPQIRVLTRANVLGHVAREIVAASGVSDDIQALVLRGFRERLLQRVELILRNGLDETVGYLAIDVDWARHQLNVKTGKNRFELDPELTVTGQIAPTLSMAVEFMQRMVAEMDVATWDSAFTPRPEVAGEATRALRLGNPTPEWLQRLQSARLSHELSTSDEGFNELGLTFRYREPETE